MPGTPTVVTRVSSGTNSVHRVTGGECDMYVKFLPDAIELAAWETLVRQRCPFLVRVAAIVDPDTPRTGDTTGTVELSPGQRRVVRTLRQSGKRYIVTLGPRSGWRRRSMWQFMDDERDAATQQAVLAEAFEAIAELHRRGVQHNDLHLTNFFVDVWDGDDPAPPRGLGCEPRDVAGEGKSGTAATQDREVDGGHESWSGELGRWADDRPVKCRWRSAAC